MSDICQNCERPFEVWEASTEHPYHYKESGLANILLTDITVYSCPNCGVASAEIPDLDGLHNLIAKDILLTPLPMSGQELRFLRKETRLKLKDFAERMGVDPKTVNNWEASESLSKPVDFTARVLTASLIWKKHEMINMFIEIGKLAQYGWETEVSENIDQDIAQLAEQNTVLEYEEHRWKLAA
jgi:DNA-binding transcriptional regulator YiaG